MKIIYVMTSSLSNWLPHVDVRLDWSYTAEQARRVANGRFVIECWRPEKNLARELTVRDERGAVHRVFPSSMRFGFEDSRSLVRELRRAAGQKDTVVEVHGIYGNLLSYEIPRLVDAPVVGQSHGWFPAASSAPGTWRSRLLRTRLVRNWLRRRRPPQSLLRELYERKALPKYRHLFSASSDEQKALADHHPLVHASVRPMALDFEQFRPADRRRARADLGLSESEKIILFVGRLDPRKGIRFLIDALPSVRRKHPNARLLIIGDGDDRPGLMRRVEELQLGSSVSFVGFIPGKQLPTWYSAADVFVLPSLGEGCSLVCREAMACGTPVVATDVGGSRDIVRGFECGVIVPPGDSGALADAVEDVLSNPAKFTPNIERGRAAFGWDGFVEERHHLYATLTGSG